MDKTVPKTFSFSIEEEKSPCVEDNLGLAFRVALHFVHDRRSVKDSEEYSDALFGLLAATRSFQRGREKFSTYATECCKNAVKDGLRKRRRIYEPLEDDIPAKNSRLMPLDLVEIFLKNHPEDTEKDRINREILKRHFINGESWEDIGNEMKLTRSAVFQRASKAIALIKERYKNIIESVEV